MHLHTVMKCTMYCCMVIAAYLSDFCLFSLRKHAFVLRNMLEDGDEISYVRSLL